MSERANCICEAIQKCLAVDEVAEQMSEKIITIILASQSRPHGVNCSLALDKMNPNTHVEKKTRDEAEVLASSSRGRRK